MKNITQFVLLPLLLCFCFSATAFAKQGSIVGSWKTIDDETNQAKSIVKIYKKGGKYYGRVTRLFRKKGEDPNPVCKKCKDGDPRKGKRVKGMVILKGLIKKDGKYSGGSILDPKNGKVYKCKIWLEKGKLKVRGYVGIFFRTQTWHKV
ncbi:MAG: DUF2147 domain-containing protein [Gammaproteobacteria bacterium]|nr:DUF2147 domain-containing protein [Gammaproteobacteria bacterium]